MYGKEYGLSQAQYMVALWRIRGYFAGSKADRCKVKKAVSPIPEDYRPRVLSDILDCVNA